jgi:hypothetical protein
MQTKTHPEGQVEVVEDVGLRVDVVEALRREAQRDVVVQHDLEDLGEEVGLGDHVGVEHDHDLVLGDLGAVGVDGRVVLVDDVLQAVVEVVGLAVRLAWGFCVFGEGVGCGGTKGGEFVCLFRSLFAFCWAMQKMLLLDCPSSSLLTQHNTTQHNKTTNKTQRNNAPLGSRLRPLTYSRQPHSALSSRTISSLAGSLPSSHRYTVRSVLRGSGALSAPSTVILTSSTDSL